MRPHQPSPSPSPPAAAASSSSSSSSSSTLSSAADPASYEHLSLSSLRAEHARSEHSLSVCEMRLKHCLDSEDQSSSSEAARMLALEKRTFRELGAALAAREKRDRSERAIREAIGNRFAGERHHIAEHRRQVETLKHRLRMAFAVPQQFGAAAPSPSGSAPSPASAATASGLSSPPPVRSSGGSPPPSYSSAFPSAASAASSASAEVSLFDLLPRMRLDVGKQQVALEHQNLRVDSIELSACVEAAQAAVAAAMAAQAAEGAAAGPSAPGGPNAHATLDRDFSSSSIQLQHPFSDELSGFFKSSRKEVVTSLQAVLAEVDGLTQHLKQAEAFILYLQIQSPAQHHQHSAAADNKMQM